MENARIMISWKVLKSVNQKCSNDDLGLILNIKLAFWAFIKISGLQFMINEMILILIL